MEQKNYEISISDIPSGSKRILKIINRPSLTYLSLTLVSLIFIIFAESYVKIIGVLLILATLYSFFKKEEKLLVELFEDFIIVYQGSSSNETCFYFEWEDIESWKIGKKQNTIETFVIHLKDNKNPIVIRSFSNFGLNSKFQKYAMDKQTDNSMQQKFLDSLS